MRPLSSFALSQAIKKETPVVSQCFWFVIHPQFTLVARGAIVPPFSSVFHQKAGYTWWRKLYKSHKCIFKAFINSKVSGQHFASKEQKSQFFSFIALHFLLSEVALAAAPPG